MSLSRRLAVTAGSLLLVVTPGVAEARVTVGPGDDRGPATQVAPVEEPTTSPTPASTPAPSTPRTTESGTVGPATSSPVPTGGPTAPSPSPSPDVPTDVGTGTPTDVPSDLRASVPPVGTTGTPDTDDRAGTPLPELRCDGPATEVASDPDVDWRHVVVDPIRRLPRDWAPDDLVEVGGLAFDGDAAPRVRALLVHDLRAMHAAATAAGARFVVVSGFRSEDHQQRLWDAEVEELGTPRRAAAGMARPGRSEHQLGTTIDVVDPALPRLGPELVDTPAGRWLAQHAAEYGFVVSYPPGARATTCFKPEPWHLRYVGASLAGRFVASGDTLREFLLAEEAESATRGRGPGRAVRDRSTAAPGSAVQPSVRRGRQPRLPSPR